MTAKMLKFYKVVILLSQQLLKHKYQQEAYEATDFNNNIAITDDLKSFKYKAKLLGNTEAQPALNNANEILKNSAIAVPL